MNTNRGRSRLRNDDVNMSLRDVPVSQRVDVLNSRIRSLTPRAQRRQKLSMKQRSDRQINMMMNDQPFDDPEEPDINDDYDYGIDAPTAIIEDTDGKQLTSAQRSKVQQTRRLLKTRNEAMTVMNQLRALRIGEPVVDKNDPFAQPKAQLVSTPLPNDVLDIIEQYYARRTAREDAGTLRGQRTRVNLQDPVFHTPVAPLEAYGEMKFWTSDPEHGLCKLNNVHDRADAWRTKYAMYMLRRFCAYLLELFEWHNMFMENFDSWVRSWFAQFSPSRAGSSSSSSSSSSGHGRPRLASLFTIEEWNKARTILTDRADGAAATHMEEKVRRYIASYVDGKDPDARIVAVAPVDAAAVAAAAAAAAEAERAAAAAAEAEREAMMIDVEAALIAAGLPAVPGLPDADGVRAPDPVIVEALLPPAPPPPEDQDTRFIREMNKAGTCLAIVMERVRLHAREMMEYLSKLSHESQKADDSTVSELRKTRSLDTTFRSSKLMTGYIGTRFYWNIATRMFSVFFDIANRNFSSRVNGPIATRDMPYSVYKPDQEELFYPPDIFPIVYPNHRNDLWTVDQIMRRTGDEDPFVWIRNPPLLRLAQRNPTRQAVVVNDIQPGSKIELDLAMVREGVEIVLNTYKICRIAQIQFMDNHSFSGVRELKTDPALSDEPNESIARYDQECVRLQNHLCGDASRTNWIVPRNAVIEMCYYQRMPRPGEFFHSPNGTTTQLYDLVKVLARHYPADHNETTPIDWRNPNSVNVLSIPIEPFDTIDVESHNVVLVKAVVMENGQPFIGALFKGPKKLNNEWQQILGHEWFRWSTPEYQERVMKLSVNQISGSKSGSSSSSSSYVTNLQQLMQQAPERKTETQYRPRLSYLASPRTPSPIREIASAQSSAAPGQRRSGKAEAPDYRTATPPPRMYMDDEDEAMNGRFRRMRLRDIR